MLVIVAITMTPIAVIVAVNLKTIIIVLVVTIAVLAKSATVIQNGSMPTRTNEIMAVAALCMGKHFLKTWTWVSNVNTHIYMCIYIDLDTHIQCMHVCICTSSCISMEICGAADIPLLLDLYTYV